MRKMDHLVTPPRVFSPVKVAESPSAKKGNLTGSPRKIKDSTATLFNLIQEWNRLHVQGINILKQIKNLKLDSLSRGIEYPPGLQELCDTLTNITLKMTTVVNSFRTTHKEFESMRKLEAFTGSKDPLFLTWRCQEFVDLSGSLHDSYSSELKVKIKVKEKVAHSKSESDLVKYCALWATQGYVHDNLDFWVESMLKETGHR